jgi:hypothetical protein
MIVCDLGDRWQLVLQTDHADLSGDIAAAWAPGSEHPDSLITAARRHDDGWAVWEQAPMCESETGKPVNFLDVGVLAHLAFYRAAIAAVTEQDAYAGLLVSMHGAGIYRGRYGEQPDLALTFAETARDQVDAFVAEQESAFTEREQRTGVTTQEREHDYRLLQIYDRMSLLFCMNDALAPPASELAAYRFEPDGAGSMRMTPFPFAGEEQRLSLVRRVLPKRVWRDGEVFREEFFATEPERIAISVRAGDG